MSEKNLAAAGYSCRVLLNQAKGTPIIFLHGLSYTCEVWQRIGVSKILEEKQVPFLALDMPYGMRSNCQPKTHSPEKNVAFVHSAIGNSFGEEVPVLVGASLGGHIALKYATMYKVKGLLLVSPARALSEEFVRSFAEFRFPVRVVWGSEDNIVSGEEMRMLVQKLPNARLVTYEGAGHSSYVAYSDKFARDLLELYATAERSGS